MLLSLNWLREFVPYMGSAEELGERLTMLGLELDGISRPFEAVNDMVIGFVTECENHPDSDHLHVCKVDVGTEVLDIVCGAPNVAKGQYVVVAPVGSRMPDGMLIKKAKLRGQTSNGMICSERELGLSDDHTGIMVLQELLSGPFTPGSNALDVLGLDREILDISVTPNRADCLSVLGLAREAALAFNLPLTLPKPDYTGVDTSGTAMHNFKIELESGDVCPLYMLQCVEGVKIGRSPASLRWRLRACGLRAISNAVDVTNYVMMELGQPLHSFDFAKVRGGVVKVALAKDGEKLVTLDGQERTLTARDITIRDAERAIGLGGVMGGANSETDASSSALVLESAVFNPSLIRKTARRLDLVSDAAYRFERGVDQNLSAYALERAAIMVARLCNGKMAKAPLKQEPRPWQAPRLSLRQDRACSLIGVELDASFCEKTLQAVGCEATIASEGGKTSWRVTPPSYRRDLEREADLIEELARVYGVDRVPETIPAFARDLSRAGLPLPKHKFLAQVKNWAAGIGLNEAVNYSFVSHSDLDFLGLPKDGRVSIRNPLTSEQDVLRPVLAPGLLNTLRNNLSQGCTGLRMFEIANGFSVDEHADMSLTGPQSKSGVKEKALLGVMFYGDRFSSAWPQAKEAADYTDLKGVVYALLQHLFPGIADEALRFAFPPQPVSWFAPCVGLHLDTTFIGLLGRVKPELADRYHARQDVWLAELDLDALYVLYLKRSVRFKALPAFPPVRRDITVIAGKGLQVADILAAIKESKPANLVDTQMIDFYQPEKSENRNLTFRLTFRHPEKTLQDADVDKARDKVARFLQEKLGVKI